MLVTVPVTGILLAQSIPKLIQPLFTFHPDDIAVDLASRESGGSNGDSDSLSRSQLDGRGNHQAASGN